MPEYIKGFNHTNSGDTEETVLTLTSTAEEPKKIIKVVIASETNNGIMKFYIEREAIGEDIPTGSLSTNQLAELPVGHDLPVGQEFKLTLKNKTAGTNATIVGYVIYEITG